VDAGRDFETEETACFAVRFYVIEEEGGNFLIFAEVVKGRKLDVVFLGPFLNNGLFRDNNSDYISLKGITINKDLSDVSRLAELLFNLVRSNILALSKLENVLLSVNNFKSTVGKEHSNVAGVHPTFSVNCLTGLVRLAEITFEVVVTLVANFTTGHRGACSRILILASIVHFGDINKLDIEAAVGTSDVTRSWIFLPGYGSRGTALSLTVTFQDLTTESNLQELKNFC
jgi:hypothetical protein